MAITYPLALPTVTGIQRISIIARAVVGISPRSFTGIQKTYEYPGQWFEASVTLPPMKRHEAEVWNSFMLALNGRRGTFLMGDPSSPAPRGSAAISPGTPLVDGAGQTGNMLDIKGLPLSATGYLKAGDYIQLGTGSATRWHKNLVDVDTDAAGKARLTVWPKLRSAPADNEAVILTNTVGLFRLADNAMSWDIDEALMYGISFSAMEVL